MDSHYTTNFELREYQKELIEYQTERNTIAVIPTGAGKTFIAVAAVVDCLNLEMGKKALFLTENVSLAIQQQAVFEKYIEPKVHVTCLYGGVSDLVVGEAKKSNVIVATVGSFLNLVGTALKMTDFCIIVFDEAHHCQKGHPFRSLMNDYYFTLEKEVRPRIMGLTASPGSKRDIEDTYKEIWLLTRNLDARITTPINNLSELETHTNFAAEICEYVGLTDTEQHLSRLFFRYFEYLWSTINSRYEIPVPIDQESSEEWDSINALNTIRNYKEEAITFSGRQDPQIDLFDHLILIIDGYLDLMDIGVSKCVRNISETFKRLNVESDLLKQPLAIYALHDLSEDGACPKVEKLLQILEQKEIERVIIFAQRQSVCHILKKAINDRMGEKVNASELVGHSSITGMSVSKQRETVKKFNQGIIDIIVATSVAEEGLDIRGCNLVIRFDCMSTVTAMIQSRGRARAENSEFIMIFRYPNASSRFLELKEREQDMLDAVQRIMTGEVTIENNPAKRIWVEETAVAILNEYCQKHALSTPTFHNYQEGYISHDPKFYMTAEIEDGEGNGKRFKSITGEIRSNKKKAKGSAAYECLLHYHNTRQDVEETFKDKFLDVIGTVRTEVITSDIKEVSDVDYLTGGKSTVSYLNEMAQKNSMTLTFNEEMEGPPHNPRITCTCICNTFDCEFTTSAVGGNKKSAKNLACARMIFVLETNKK